MSIVSIKEIIISNYRIVLVIMFPNVDFIKSTTFDVFYKFQKILNYIRIYRDLNCCNVYVSTVNKKVKDLLK